jgi:hypothetical protein
LVKPDGFAGATGVVEVACLVAYLS